MIEQLPEPAPDILSVKVSGKLRHEDFDKVLGWVDATVASHGKCRLLVVFGDFHGWDVRSFWDDLKFHSTHCDDVERMAYVGNKTWEHAMVNMSKLFTKSAIRYFDATEINAARTWLAHGR